MNIMRASEDQKKAMVVSALRAIHRKEQKLLGVYHWVTASQVAKQIGYKSGNSVRATLYQLVDQGIVQMYVGGKVFKDNARVFFRTTLDS